jgi:hypothetical protein
MLSFTGTEQNGNGAASASPAPSAENGAEGASLAMLPSSRQVVRAHLRVLLRSLRRSSRARTLHRVEARRRTVTWSPPEELQVELSRSRRYGHPFVLVRIPCGHADGGGSNGRDEVARTVSSLLRQVDRVWPGGTSLYLLLPECDRARAEAMLARIREPLAKHLAEEELLAISSALFPDDGFTSGALFDALDARSISLATRPAPMVVAPATPEAPVA